jgi:hypothetical protein
LYQKPESFQCPRSRYLFERQSGASLHAARGCPNRVDCQRDKLCSMSIECDRMMALMPRKEIYLFGVCLFAMFV